MSDDTKAVVVWTTGDKVRCLGEAQDVFVIAGFDVGGSSAALKRLDGSFHGHEDTSKLTLLRDALLSEAKQKLLDLQVIVAQLSTLLQGGAEQTNSLPPLNGTSRCADIPDLGPSGWCPSCLEFRGRCVGEEL